MYIVINGDDEKALLCYSLLAGYINFLGRPRFIALSQKGRGPKEEEEEEEGASEERPADVEGPDAKGRGSLVATHID